uniref:ADAM metallopeptidase domain 20 n=1 Tax=Oryctolagus cuniculus TaxID=9986 RepID=A0A5F9C8B3_RABIT
MRCGLTEESIAHQLELQASYISTLKQSSYVGWWTHQRFVELGVVVDHVRFLYSQSNVSVVYYEVYVINIVDEFYHPLEIDVFLIGIEIWTKRNPISTNDDLDQVGQDFSVWKSTNLQHDAAHLFIKELNGLKLGVAYFKGICPYPFNCAVDVFEDKWLSVFAITVAHELGCNLGMLHDTEWCVCEQECTTRQRISVVSCGTGPRLCILASPFHGNIYRLKHCGNQVVEVGEECDCGFIQQCQHDPCLVSCKDYKFMPSGTLCRQQVNLCDLPEWCNGTSHECPDDIYVQYGMPCDSNSYRFKKMCNNHDTQCKKIFGREARSASEICYNEMNTQGNRFGHCGIEGTTYVKCMAPDVMCGRVQCENVLTIPTLIEHSTVHQFHFNGTTCWGTDYHLGMSIPDIGEVKDGTVCAPGKTCLCRKCVSMVHLPKYCEPLYCSMRGVCNNKQHCHCRCGWASPYCSSRGYGGSMDSGPPSNIKLEGSHMEGNMGFLLPLLLISWVVLCLFCFLVLCTKERRGERK